MNDNPAPQAATELFTESYLLSPKQREVLTVLQSFPGGARAIEVANALDMHVNTARGHLEELVSQNTVRVITAPAKGRGRPSLIFQTRVPDNRAVAEEYITLIELMASMLGDPDEEGMKDPATLAKAKALGAQWATIMGTQTGDATKLNEALSPLMNRLRTMGFDPTTENALPAAAPAEEGKQEDISILLNSCPFIVGGERPSNFICAVHGGFIEKTLETSGKISLELTPFNAPGTCQVQVSQQG